MNLHRNVYINPVEPEYLAFRVSQGIDTKVNFHFKTQAGGPIASDVVAQMQLTSRSRNIVEFYSCPAVDIVNGIARATIPADIMHDPNGWNLRLTGTIAGEPRVLAYGVMTTIAGAGPQAEPQDIIDTIDLSLTRGTDAVINVKLWADAGKGTPYDLTAAGTAVSSKIYERRGGTVLANFDVAVVAANEVVLTLPADTVTALPDLCWWTLIATTPLGTTTLCEGEVTVSG